MIKLDELTKIYQSDGERVRALDAISLEIPTGSFFTLLGPSGCGKSTLLRCVAGLETPDGGSITSSDVTLYSARSGVSVPPNKRRMGMVFQSYAIWPHMTVYGNVAFPLEAQKQDRIHERVLAALELVGLGQFADRYASRLSGGQQQRVAFARAIVAEPDVLLLDEPLSNLDAALRDHMRAELRELQQRLRITTLYVTHDQQEALSMSDWIAVMRQGHVLEVGAPAQLFSAPRHTFSASFIGGANVIPARPAGEAGAALTPFGPFRLAGAVPSGPFSLFVRPEKVVISRERPAGQNVFEAVVASHRFNGDHREVDLLAVSPDGSGGDGVRLRGRIDPSLPLNADDRVHFHIEPGHAVALADD